MTTKSNIFDRIKNYLDIRYGWIIKAWKSKVRVTPSGDIYIKGSEVFKGREKEWRDYLTEIEKQIKISK
nr:hypothetical protein [uncultured Flavobacterium sp.]